jgi:peptidoglycan/xylan/chitin deacetylase (PgdA/CDA1 family)
VNAHHHPRSRRLLGRHLVVALGAIALTAGVAPSAVPRAWAAGSEIVPGGDFETPDPANASVPTGWYTADWGGNSTTFSYPDAGAHGGARDVRVDMTGYTDGGATWTFAAQPVSAGAAYLYTSWYQASVPVEMLAVFTRTDGTTGYALLGTASPSATWKQFKATFAAPAGATDLRVFQSITAIGWLELDDVSVAPFTPQPFTRPLVSLTFDDGYASHMSEALPKLVTSGLPGTFYLASGDLGTAPPPAMMTRAQVPWLSLFGMEVAAHTVTHVDLTTVSDAQLTTELVNSQSDLRTLSGQQVTDFATPFGAYNDAVLARIMSLYATHRTVADGFNDRDTLDFSRIKAKQVVATTTVAQVQGWLATARSQGTWLVLVFHDIIANATEYDMTPATFRSVIDAVKQSGTTVETIAAARAELAPQVASR